MNYVILFESLDLSISIPILMLEDILIGRCLCQKNDFNIEHIFSFFVIGIGSRS